MKKKKLWNSKKADREFSLYIRARDKKCLVCGSKEYLQVSHFWGRLNSAVRYDEENCITLCAGCHFFYENEKQGRYRDFMLKWLGEKRYNELEKRAHSHKKRREVLKEVQEKLVGLSIN